MTVGKYSMSQLVTPVTYQGGKSRLADAIVDRIVLGKGPFIDLCCGSGAISLEMRNRGVPAERIWMADKGPWGLVWKVIGEGAFDLAVFERYCNRIPKDLTKVRDFMQELSRQPASIDTPYVYLLLQASSFGGKAIWIQSDEWKNTSFRSYWTPTATSSRRSPVNPMMPMPETILARMKDVCREMRGCHGFHEDVTNVPIPVDATVYVDPPYRMTTGYGHVLDVEKFVRSTKHPLYVSEGYAVTNNAICLSEGRKKGGISGERGEANAEWLSMPVTPVMERPKDD